VLTELGEIERKAVKSSFKVLSEQRLRKTTKTSDFSVYRSRYIQIGYPLSTEVRAFFMTFPVNSNVLIHG